MAQVLLTLQGSHESTLGFRFQLPPRSVLPAFRAGGDGISHTSPKVDTEPRLGFSHLSLFTSFNTNLKISARVAVHGGVRAWHLYVLDKSRGQW